MNKIFTKLTTVLLLVVGGMSIVSAQVYKKIGDSPFTLKPSAALEIASTNKGFLPPRVAKNDLISKPAKGLVIYSLATHGLEVNVGGDGVTSAGSDADHLAPSWKSTVSPSEPQAKIVTSTVDGTVSTTATTVLANANGGDVVITLPLASVAGNGQIYIVGKTDSSSHTVKINTTAGSGGAGLILSQKTAATASVAATYVTISEVNYPISFRIQSDGTNWYIID